MKKMKRVLALALSVVSVGLALATPAHLRAWRIQENARAAAIVAQQAGTGQQHQKAPEDPEIHRAAREGNVALLSARLRQGADPNLRDGAGRTALFAAVAAGQLDATRLLLASGSNVNAKSPEGRTPLIEAAEMGQVEAARLLVDGGADLKVNQRGWGTALDTAERTGHSDLAEMLRLAGAHSATGRSVGDTVCVRPWKGDGYCGTVETVNRSAYTIRITKIVGCENGCSARTPCSAGKVVGTTEGLQVGDTVATVSSCLTHTGVEP